MMGDSKEDVLRKAEQASSKIRRAFRAASDDEEKRP